MSGRALGLRDLVVVVDRREVVSAGVDVELLAQVLHAHAGALDVPAGESLSPRARPSLRPIELPEGEVARVLLF